MLRETVLSAVIAGLIAALALTAMQAVWITPLILKAEAFENGEVLGAQRDVGPTQAGVHAHEHAAAANDSADAHGHVRAANDSADAHEHVAAANYLADAHDHVTATNSSADAHDHTAGAAADHHHDSSEWRPRDGFQRTAFTFGANMLMSFGYAFLLTAVYLLWREPRNAGWGALYGVAGFIVFFAAPALGLPPELPGTAAAELTARQQWWILIAATTGIGLLLVFSRLAWWMRLSGALLIVAPHFVPAPSPEAYASLAPEDLQTQFRWATALCNAVFWLLLGLTSTITLKKLLR